ncbi:MAG: hypothetical protein K2X48_16705 [Chitinophagaceae bacterium]|nr:hypothetical protein [Chitinophagaceae bacterium]
MPKSLFDIDNHSSHKKEVAVRINTGKKLLTKNQQAFNKLTTRINKLRNEVTEKKEKYNKIFHIYNTEITPVILELGNEKIKLAKALFAKYTTIKLAIRQKEQVESIIYSFLSDAFTVIAPDEEAEQLYNQFSERAYQEERKEQEESMKSELQDELKKEFGIEINLNDFAGDPAGFEKLHQELNQKFEQQQSQKKKTKKQLEKEQILKQEEEIKKRSLRSIYMALVKLLHPDAELDETIRLEKEEIMKQVTAAYNTNNLQELLKLELQWVAKENDHLEQLTDEKLKIYNTVLKEQVKELEIEKMMIDTNPAFQPLGMYRFCTMQKAALLIADERNGRLEYIEQIRKDCNNLLNNTRTRDAIRICISNYCITYAQTQQDFERFMDVMDSMMRKH